MFFINLLDERFQTQDHMLSEVSMKLDRKERFAIANQLKILEALYPEEASHYAIQRTAFEDGYESHYEWAMESISNDVLSEEESDEVINTLDMFSALKRSVQKLDDKTGLDEYDFKFRGYDGNHPKECKLLGYARYFVIELERFQDVLDGQTSHFDFNSHMEIRSVYSRMLSEWMKVPSGIELGSRHNLTKAQIQTILNATTHPSD